MVQVSYTQSTCSTNKITNGTFDTNANGWTWTGNWFHNDSSQVLYVSFDTGNESGTASSNDLSLCANTPKQVKFSLKFNAAPRRNRSSFTVKLGGQEVLNIPNLRNGNFTSSTGVTTVVNTTTVTSGNNGTIARNTNHNITLNIVNYTGIANNAKLEFTYNKQNNNGYSDISVDNVEVYELSPSKPANPSPTNLTYNTGGTADLTTSQPASQAGLTYEWYTVASNPTSATKVNNPSSVTSGTYYLYARSSCGTTCISPAADQGVVVTQSNGGGNPPTNNSDWLCGCSKRKKITLNNTSTPLANYQMRIDVAHNANMATDFSDLRFTSSDGTTEIPYWIETQQASVSSVVWAKVPSITANSTTDIYMYYGGCNSSNNSNASAVFDFFDDMNSSTGWNNLGNQTNFSTLTYNGVSVLRRQNECDPNGAWKSLGATLSSFRLITREQRPNGSTASCDLNRYGVENSSFNGYGINRSANTTGGNTGFGFERRQGGGGGNSQNVSVSQPRNTWYRTELRRCQTGNSNEAILYNDNRTQQIGSVSGSITNHNYSNFDRVVVRGGREYYVDFMAVAKYTCNEPTITIGSEENNTNVIPCPTTPTDGVDTDGDGVPDYRDLDADNDGILNENEPMHCDPQTPPYSNITGNGQKGKQFLLFDWGNAQINATNPTYTTSRTYNGVTYTALATYVPAGSSNSSSLKANLIKTWAGGGNQMFWRYANYGQGANDNLKGVLSSSTGAGTTINFKITVFAEKNGVRQAINVLVFDAESTGNTEELNYTTNASPFQLVDNIGGTPTAAEVTGVGTNTLKYIDIQSQGKSLIAYTRGTTVTITGNLKTRWGQAVGVGVWLYCDTDNDGIPNYLDSDSDGDGCNDVNEAYNNPNADADNNGFYGSGTPTIDADGKVTTAPYTAPHTISVTDPNNSSATINSPTFLQGIITSITQQPTPIAKCNGETVTLTATAQATVSTTFPATTASTQLGYQWQVDTGGGNFANVTNVNTGATVSGTSGTVNSGQATTLTLTNATQTGKYRVVFTNEANVCNEISNEVTVTVNNATIIGNPNICADSQSKRQLFGSGTPATTNAWVSSNTTVATIDDNGLVTGVGAGTTIITYTDANGCTATKSLTVATCTDTDGDGVPDFRDLDNDNDGILDIHECKPKRFVWSGAPTSGQTGQTITGISGSTTVTITDNSTLTSPRKVTQVYIYGGDSGLATSGVLLKNADENGNYAYLHPADRGATYTLSFNAPTTEKLYFYMTALDVKKVEFTNGTIIKAKGGAGVGTNTFINTTPTSGSDSRGLTVEIPAGTETFSYKTTTPGDGYMISLSSGCTDYDNDGIPNYLDPDSDGDGCFDAIEGGGNVTASNVNASGQITNNAGNVVVDANGIPNSLLSGQNQSVGDSQKATKITVTTPPANTSVCVNSNATFSATIKSIEATQFSTGVPDYTNNIIDAAFYYIWQVDKNDGNGFVNMTGTGVSGTANNGATVTLNLGTQANADKNGYKYRLSIASSKGNCSTESNEAILTVNPLPNNIGSGFSAGNICEGEQGTLTFNGINIGSYPYTIKYINNANSSAIHEQNIANASAQTFNAPDLNTSSPAGTYNYTLLSITDANGCTLSEAASVPSSSSVFGKKAARIIIRENPANVVAISVNSNTVCIGETAPVVTFTNSDTKPIIVTYTVNGGTDQNIEVPKKVGATNGSATVNVATTNAGTYTYNATKVKYKSSPNCEANINLSQCIVVFPTNSTAPTVNSGTGTPISVTSPTAVTGFSIQYSFDDGATWGANTPPTADNCAGYKIRTRYVLASACGTTSAGSTNACAVSPATTRVVDTTAPTFDVPTTAISECVNNIIEASYNNTTNGDINNPPDYYEFTANNTSLDISNFQDNCCTDAPTISWSISPASNGATILGTGQPSQSTGGKKLWLNISTVNPKASYVQKTYTITYNVTDCNGNTATKTRNIIITPRPKIIKVN